MQFLRCYEGVPPLKGQAKGFRRAWCRKQYSEENVNIGQNLCVNKSKTHNCDRFCHAYMHISW